MAEWRRADNWLMNSAFVIGMRMLMMMIKLGTDRDRHPVRFCNLPEGVSLCVCECKLIKLIGKMSSFVRRFLGCLSL